MKNRDLSNTAACFSSARSFWNKTECDCLLPMFAAHGLRDVTQFNQFPSELKKIITKKLDALKSKDKLAITLSNMLCIYDLCKTRPRGEKKMCLIVSCHLLAKDYFVIT